MSLRNDLVVGTMQALLGPRDGANEILPASRDPRQEYVTGVLAPRPPAGASLAPLLHDIDADADLIEGDVDDVEDEDDPGVISASAVVSPALDPRALPRSIGLTFVVEGCEPQLNICATFARYLPIEQNSKDRMRQPYGFVTGFVAANDTSISISPGNTEIRIRRTPVPGNPAAQRISIYLLNVADSGDPEEPPPTESLIFQPQIRVSMGRGCNLVSLLRSRVEEDEATDPVLRHEEESLALLYHDRPVLARGHLCAAIWREIDPERPVDEEPSPFVWTDETAVPATQRDRFRIPDLRTEIIPLYAVTSPAMQWRAQYGPEPQLDPLQLSQTWQPDAVRAALEPLPNSYNVWIEEREGEIAALPETLRDAAERHLNECRTARDRLQAAIDLIASDEEVRLAFCYANHVIAEQASWRQKSDEPPFGWRPFQLAFILLCLPGVAHPTHPDRQSCDLLWFATGGGKTEAYLGLAAFTLGLRRLRAERDDQGLPRDTGVGVISRYTLRLLTIQQFRRALGMITACEMMRVQPSGNSIGWRPDECAVTDSFLWGTARFSAGLWVGGNVTPNRMETIGYPHRLAGALDLLKGASGAGEPALVLRCPCCNAHLAISQPPGGRQERPAFPPGQSDTLHFVFYSDDPPPNASPSDLSNARIEVTSAFVTNLPEPGFWVLAVDFISRGDGASASDVNQWWKDVANPALGGYPSASLQSAQASRPGYFVRSFRTQQNRDKDYDFEIYCPSPKCPTSAYSWREKVPVPVQLTAATGADGWQEVIEPFRKGNATTGCRLPIPALTVDEQVYAHPPSLLVATVDKFARLAFEPRAASIFGHVTNYHARAGYYRQGCVADKNSEHPPVPALTRQVERFEPPDLILQDELHLIDGPLGSMVGLYESAIDALAESCNGDVATRPKYIASTATVRRATEQVQALFCRELRQFPPSGLSAGDNFFARTSELHPAQDNRPGRLYMGVCAPGKGAQTPIVHLWSALLQRLEVARLSGLYLPDDLDRFWTLVGYFNAIRELAGATGLYRQDIPQRIKYLASLSSTMERDIASEPVELSSRADALQLPALLARLEATLPDAENVALATSMFGTGVDVNRLGLMVVHGQPKTCSSYIQATGRVGRKNGGLVATFLRASRPRDLDHYEFFTGYHRQLYRAVEPVTVAPFSPRARERALGPLCVALLRQAEQVLGYPVHEQWRRDGQSQRMATARSTSEVLALLSLLEDRAQGQPDGRRPIVNITRDEVASELDRWRTLAQQKPGVDGLKYQEYALVEPPEHPVVLGDAQHERRQLDVAYENAPQSLRDVEATTGFRV